MSAVFDLRPGRPTDREAAYAICLQTGDAGQDATPLHQDRELLGHVHVGPYLALEADLVAVLEDAAGVCGYVVGVPDTRLFRRRLEDEWLPPLRRRYPAPAGNPSHWSPDEQLCHLIHRPPEAPASVVDRFPAHLHINLLPRAQGRGQGHRMMAHLLSRLRGSGASAVHLGVLARNRRAVRFYRGLGFGELLEVGAGRQAAIYFGLEL